MADVQLQKLRCRQASHSGRAGCPGRLVCVARFWPSRHTCVRLLFHLLFAPAGVSACAFSSLGDLLFFWRARRRLGGGGAAERGIHSGDLPFLLQGGEDLGVVSEDGTTITYANGDVFNGQICDGFPIRGESCSIRDVHCPGGEAQLGRRQPAKAARGSTDETAYAVAHGAPASQESVGVSQESVGVSQVSVGVPILESEAQAAENAASENERWKAAAKLAAHALRGGLLVHTEGSLPWGGASAGEMRHSDGTVYTGLFTVGERHGQVRPLPIFAALASTHCPCSVSWNQQAVSLLAPSVRPSRC